MITLRIRELAEARGYNISSLSRAADIAYTTAYSLWYDSAGRWDRAVLSKVAHVLQVDGVELFTWNAPDHSTHARNSSRSAA